MTLLELTLTPYLRILTVGPTFKILGQVTGDLDIGVDLKADLSYTVKDAKLFFPPSKPSIGQFSQRPNRMSQIHLLSLSQNSDFFCF